MIEFFVPGKAAPQGSKRHVGRGVLIESSKEVGPWRERVALAAHNAMKGESPFVRTRPLWVDIQFFLPRPNAAPKAQAYNTKRPDIDKLARACLDALTDVCFEDDSQVVNLTLYKRYAPLPTVPAPGARIRVSDLEAEK